MTDELWQRAVKELDEGNFTALETALGGPEEFDRLIVEWYGAGRFNDYPEMLSEAFTCACMLGRVETAKYLLRHGVDPLAGMKTGLSGFHYAVSSGHLAIVKLLIERNVSTTQVNMYGGTVMEQALWSAVNEAKPEHSAIIELLVDSGAPIEPGTAEWWLEQPVSSEETRERIARTLRKGTKGK